MWTEIQSLCYCSQLVSIVKEYFVGIFYSLNYIFTIDPQSLTSYLFSILNRIGVGEKSEILTTKTQGVEPTIPEPQSFLEVSPGSVTLHLNAWENGGCPIVYFVVEYKPRYFSYI